MWIAHMLAGLLVGIAVAGVGFRFIRGKRPEGEVIDALVRERRRIAREVHDVVGHGLVLIAMQARELPRVAPQHRTISQAIDQTVQQTLREVRELMGVLRTAEDPEEPFVSQIGALVARLPSTGPQVVLETRGLEPELTGELRTTALRVVQEGLTNALKHAGPGRIALSLDFADDPGSIAIEMRNECGETTARIGTGYGLPGLRERVETHGGVFESRRGADGVFQIRAWLPLDGGSSRQHRPDQGMQGKPCLESVS